MSHQEIRQEEIECTFSFKSYQSTYTALRYLFIHLFPGLLNDVSRSDHKCRKIVNNTFDRMQMEAGIHLT
jgi:hypothetical protein